MIYRQAYARLRADDLILRDELALDRTILANERTLLSYIRSAFALVIAGLSFMEFFSSSIATLVGALFIPTGLVFLVIGVVRFQRFRRQLGRLATASNPAD